MAARVVGGLRSVLAVSAVDLEGWITCVVIG